MKVIMRCDGAKDRRICTGCRRLTEGSPILQWRIKPEIDKGVCANHTEHKTEEQS